MDVRELAAEILGCQPEELLGFRPLKDGGASVIGPDGKKYVLTATYMAEERARRRAAARLAPAEAAPRTPASAGAKRRPKAFPAGSAGRPKSAARPDPQAGHAEGAP